VIFNLLVTFCPGRIDGGLERGIAVVVQREGLTHLLGDQAAFDDQ
jgi:hypothetical protein